MKKQVVLSLCVIALSITGCSSAPNNDSSEPAVIAVGNVDYDSLYHFGYNRGCESAIAEKGSNQSVDSMKDTTLNGIDSFEDGWRSGTENCNGGEYSPMYTVGLAQ
ncbi:hypothetical protein [Shewanella donghaensis]|uniref:hypothetical protein n=1 Tax=Shewanella donghaensis TaxID=238836 RepID=UPI0011845F72|nr:hypothetical protein [Shewanella donghaensis]